MIYFVRSPWWLKKIYSKCVWEIPSNEKAIYLSFDDGPHPVATTFVLDELKKFDAKATFFCIGKNVVGHTELYRRILDEGHKVGNHTYDHLNGWNVRDEEFFENISKAQKFIDSDLFRPPYGRITRFQASLLSRSGLKIVMWSALSGDFDQKITPQQCLQNVILNGKPGSIITFHDSERALPHLRYALPVVLKHFIGLGYTFRRIDL